MILCLPDQIAIRILLAGEDLTPHRDAAQAVACRCMVILAHPAASPLAMAHGQHVAGWIILIILAVVLGHIRAIGLIE